MPGSAFDDVAVAISTERARLEKQRARLDQQRWPWQKRPWPATAGWLAGQDAPPFVSVTSEAREDALQTPESGEPPPDASALYFNAPDRGDGALDGTGAPAGGSVTLPAAQDAPQWPGTALARAARLRPPGLGTCSRHSSLAPWQRSGGANAAVRL
jgi:hypothetical protein